MNGRQVIEKLKAVGWRLRGIAGSHHFMEKDGKKVPVPVHGNRDLAAGTLAAIRRQTGETLR